ncbi:MAG: class I SAM-dependent methyltransferase [Candidatus Diapherotrites archaeon]|nr:class I SAM-dependent methyltransferase [Candidatus Diapherotrites archaeon]
MRKYIFEDVNASLHSIGFSKVFRKDLIKALEKDQIKKFRNKHFNEITKKYVIGFRQKVAPSFLENEFIPHIPSAKLIIDVGCGTGALPYRLSKYNRFKKIIGVDVTQYPEWKLFSNAKTEFIQINPNSLENILKSFHPDVVTLTWSLHHMPKINQKSYLQGIYDALPNEGKVIILEDSYSTKKRPLKGARTWAKFMRLKPRERQKVMSMLDWVANKVLSGRAKIPMPYSYRTTEEWTKLCERMGYRVKTRYFGFPNKRDINNPQALIQLTK